MYILVHSSKDFDITYCYGLNCVPPAHTPEVLKLYPLYPRMWPCLERGSLRMSSVKMRPYWGLGALNFNMTGILIRRWPYEDQTHRENATWRQQRLELGSGKPRKAKDGQLITRSQKELERIPLHVSERSPPCQHLDFRPPSSRIVRQWISIVLSYPVFGTLSVQP